MSKEYIYMARQTVLVTSIFTGVEKQFDQQVYLQGQTNNISKKYIYKVRQTNMSNKHVVISLKGKHIVNLYMQE